MKFKYAVWASYWAVMIGRVFITPRLTNIPTVEGAYEVFAHGLIGFMVLAPFYDPKEQLGPSKLFAWMGWGASIIWEGGWFAFQKWGHGL